MPMDILKPVAEKSLSQLDNNRESANNAADAILTTDTVRKECAVEHELNDGTVFKVAGICKGSGMIAPNMGTMLGFITTDLKVPQDTLQKALNKSIKKSFNMVVVDGDESTNDTVLLLSTNDVEGEIDENFQEALDYVCTSLAKQIARDGEGADKFMEVTASGAKSEDDAKEGEGSEVITTDVKDTKDAVKNDGASNNDDEVILRAVEPETPFDNSTDVPDGTYYMVIKDEQEKDENEMYSEIVEITSRSEFELDKDGMYNIYLFTIPNVTFEDGKIKIDEYESYDSKKLILSHINNIFTIGGYECIEQEVLCICNLKKCLLNLQMKAFKEGTANCGSTKCKNQENKSQRDYIFLGV
jgi:Icc-related predicted phosphoesterase